MATINVPPWWSLLALGVITMIGFVVVVVVWDSWKRVQRARDDDNDHERGASK